MKCRLCNHQMISYKTSRKREYLRCTHCDSIQLSDEYLLNQAKEKHRYDLHNNDPNDLFYQSFVSPVTNHILTHFNPLHKGLDYGAGPGPVIYHLLKDKSYQIDLYDPYYYPNQQIFNQKYDYIYACEVIEHFYHPVEDFKKIYELLNHHGELILMTSIFNNQIDFDQWHYKNDETHVIFYTNHTLKYIQETFGFSRLLIQDNLIILTK